VFYSNVPKPVFINWSRDPEFIVPNDSKLQNDMYKGHVDATMPPPGGGGEGVTETSSIVTILVPNKVNAVPLGVKLSSISIVSLPSVVKSDVALTIKVAVPDDNVPTITTEPEFTSRSPDPLVPTLVQYKDVPGATSVVVTVNATPCPSSIVVLDGVMVYVGFKDVSLIVTVFVPKVVNAVPPDERLNSITMVSLPSVRESPTTFIVNEAVPLAVVPATVTDPELALTSPVPLVPMFFQYKVVPGTTSIVAIVNVTEPDSFTVVADGVIV